MRVYEVRPRRDVRGFDLISGARLFTARSAEEMDTHIRRHAR